MPVQTVSRFEMGVALAMPVLFTLGNVRRFLETLLLVDLQFESCQGTRLCFSLVFGCLWLSEGDTVTNISPVAAAREPVH